MTDEATIAALNAAQTLALTISGEADTERVEGKIFVGCVVRNRVQRGTYGGNTYKAVCLSHLQFSCWWPQGGRENYERVMMLATGILLPIPHIPAALWESLYLAEGIIAGQLQDRSLGATHYVTKALYRVKPPNWTIGLSAVVEVGAHLGFKL